MKWEIYKNLKFLRQEKNLTVDELSKLSGVSKAKILSIERELSFEHNIEDIANNVRSYWGLGFQPIENMVNLLENKGIIVSTLNINNKKIDAFTQVHEINNKEKYCVVLSNDKQSVARRNFDAAHELGHIILHKNILYR